MLICISHNTTTINTTRNCRSCIIVIAEVVIIRASFSVSVLIVAQVVEQNKIIGGVLLIVLFVYSIVYSMHRLVRSVFLYARQTNRREEDN